MRDPNRIDGILEELKELWKKVPDWRLSQLFCNVQRNEGYDQYYYEDEELINAIKNFLGCEDV